MDIKNHGKEILQARKSKKLVGNLNVLVAVSIWIVFILLVIYKK